MPGRDTNPGGEKEELNMKKTLLVAAVAVIVIAMAGGASAAPAAPTTDVSASVTPICMSNGNGVMSITIDPSAVGALGYTFQGQGTVTQPQVKCTKSATALFTITASNAEGSNGAGSLAGLLKNGSHPDIPYMLTFNPSVVGNGFAGANVNININGSITQGAAQAAEYDAAAYQETVTLTFNY